MNAATGGSERMVHMLPARREGGGSPVRSFRSELDQLFNSFFGGGLMPGLEPEPGAMSGADFDLIDTEDGYELVADLPGFRPEEVDIQVVGDTLVIDAEQNEEQPA